jgi:hypothetical protein
VIGNFHKAQKKNRAKAWRGLLDDNSDPRNAVPLICAHTIAYENLIEEWRKIDLHLQGRVDDEGETALEHLAKMLSGQHPDPPKQVN